MPSDEPQHEGGADSEDFLSLASHQLRTPLSSIKLYVEMLRNGSLGELNEAQTEVIHNIEVANERMIQLVDNLLQLSHIEGGDTEVNPQETDLRDVTEEVIREASAIASAENVDIRFTYQDEIDPRTISDPHLLQHILSNLIRNAIQYSKASSDETKHVIVTIGWEQDTKAHHLRVEDEGIGIPADPQIREKIFNRFYRAPNATEIDEAGDGLGLYMCKQFIKWLEGDIWFESREGKGSTFHLRIPSLEERNDIPDLSEDSSQQKTQREGG